MKLVCAMSRGTWLVTPNKFLNASQVESLRQSVEAERRSGARYCIRNAAIVETLLSTGLRVSELCSLAVADLFLEAGSANVLVRHGKGGKARLVAISTSLALYLERFLMWKASVGEPSSPTSPVFLSGRSASLHRSTVHRIWKVALKNASLPRHHGVHAARHSYAVEIYRRTKDLRLTQRQLGHSSPNTTQVYASLVDDDVRRGVEAVWAASP